MTPRSTTQPSLALPLAAATAIALVTLPWDIQNHAHWQKVAWVPFTTGIVRPIDLVANATLYFPLGLAIPSASPRRKVALALVVALGMSTLLELAQVWSHSRFPSATDIVMNVVGSVAGALVATGAARRTTTPARPMPCPTSHDRSI